MRAGWVEQAAGVCGIPFVLLYGIARFLPGLTPPAPDASTRAVAHYLAIHGTALPAQTYLVGLALILGLAFLAALWSALREIEGGPGTGAALVLGAGIVLISTLAVAQALVAGAATLAGTSGVASTIAPALYDLARSVQLVVFFPIAALAGTTTLVVVRAEAFPPVVRWSGTLVVALSLVAALALFTTHGPLALAPYLGLTAFAAWTAATSVVLLMRPTGLTAAERAALLLLERVGR